MSKKPEDKVQCTAHMMKILTQAPNCEVTTRYMSSLGLIVSMKSHGVIRPVNRLLLQIRSPILKQRIKDLLQGNPLGLDLVIDVTNDMTSGETMIRALQVLHGEVATTMTLGEANDLANTLEIWCMGKNVEVMRPPKN